MSRILKWSLILGIIIVLVLGMVVGQQQWKERNRPQYREVEVTRGKIVAVVNSTGTVKPVRSVQVGSFVSGPIEAVYVNFNQEVKKGDPMAKIDPAIYQANVARDKAFMETRIAEVKQAQARLDQAKNDEDRALALAKAGRDRNLAFISESDLDQYKYNHLALKASLAVADANVISAKAVLDLSDANLKYTEIVAPEEGVVIDRKIDPGQTVAATFQTPDLFTVAYKLYERIHVYASVDEGDIGVIRAALDSDLPVRFTVDAHPDELFEGKPDELFGKKIFQIRQNSTTVQNVVTYPVVISAPNTSRKLFPGMTANVSFQIGERVDKLRIPNAALRYFPPRDQVRLEDRKILEGAMHIQDPDDQVATSRSAEEKADMRKSRNRRHVWVVDGERLRAVEVVVGLSDGKNTEVISGDVDVGTKLVTGVQPRN